MRAEAKDIYIAQSQTGGATGADCANARSVGFFNTASNWGSGSTQIGPGTVVHLCGTFTGAAGSTMLTIQSAGTSGNPITILFEPGAKLTAPYWNTAISCTNQNYIVIDGGSNGSITTTANGTAMANQRNSEGVRLENCSNSEVRNLSIGPMYVRTPNSSDSCGCGIGVHLVEGSNYNVHDNRIFEAQYTIFGQYGASNSNWTYRGNVLSRTAGCMIIGDGNDNSSMNNALIDGNECSDTYVWDSPGDIYHCDGIHTWATNRGSALRNLTVRNNYFHGNWGAHTTGLIFSSSVGGNNQDNYLVYNNILTGTTGTTDGYIVFDHANNAGIYNNTFSGPGSSTGTAITWAGSNGVNVRNNIISGLRTAIFVQALWGSTVGTSDNNLVNCTGSLGSCFVYQDSFSTWESWRSRGFDANSIGPTASPNLTSDHRLQSTSPARSLGANLSGMGISSLNLDAVGVPRPSSGSWDGGAYVFGVVSNLINPPTGLKATVQ